MADHESSRKSLHSRPPEPSLLLHGVVKVFEKLGIPSGLLFGIVMTAYLLASDTTKDQIVREIYFGGTVEGTPWLRIVVGLLMLLVLLGGTSVFRFLSTDAKEMKRMAAEKAALQEHLLGRRLHHTDSVPDLPALPGDNKVRGPDAEGKQSSVVVPGEAGSRRP